MADRDLSFLVGELKGEFKSIKDHLTQQDHRTEVNKKAAIDARQRLESKVDTIGQQTAEHAEWIRDHGQPMALEWAKSRDRRRLAKAELRGRAMTWAKVGGAVMLILTGIGYLGKDAVAAVLRRISDFLQG